MSVCLSISHNLSTSFNQNYWPLYISGIMPIGHHAYLPSYLYLPSCQYHSSEFQDFRTALKACLYYSRLLSFLCCYHICHSVSKSVAGSLLQLGRPPAVLPAEPGLSYHLLQEVPHDQGHHRWSTCLWRLAQLSASLSVLSVRYSSGSSS